MKVNLPLDPGFNNYAAIFTASKQPDVTLFVAVERTADLISEYRLAHRTLKCYCAMNNYPLVVIDLSEYRQDCPQKDVCGK